VTSLAEVNAELGKFEPYTQARKIASLIPEVGSANVDLAALKDPHELEGLDIAIIAGEFGVAENGAVWVPGSTLGPHRAIFVVTQHLVLIVPAGQIVHNMQQAYDRIRLERPGFGIFISGPSKTADIEQVLVPLSIETRSSGTSAALQVARRRGRPLAFKSHSAPRPPQTPAASSCLLIENASDQLFSLSSTSLPEAFPIKASDDSGVIHGGFDRKTPSAVTSTSNPLHVK